MLLSLQFHKDICDKQKWKSREGSFQVPQVELPGSKDNQENDKNYQEESGQLYHAVDCTPLSGKNKVSGLF